MVNPHLKPEENPLWGRKISKDDAEELFWEIFRTRPDLKEDDDSGIESDDEEWEHEPGFVKGVKEKLKEFLDSCENVDYKEFAILILETIVEVMQDHLHLVVKAFYSRDKDEIFLKVRATEENLKVQADLVDYRL